MWDVSAQSEVQVLKEPRNHTCIVQMMEDLPLMMRMMTLTTIGNNSQRLLIIPKKHRKIISPDGLRNNRNEFDSKNIAKQSVPVVQKNNRPDGEDDDDDNDNDDDE